MSFKLTGSLAASVCQHATSVWNPRIHAAYVNVRYGCVDCITHNFVPHARCWTASQGAHRFFKQCLCSGVDIHLEDGGKLRAKLVIGADGTRSCVASALGLSTPNYSGYSAYRSGMTTNSCAMPRLSMLEHVLSDICKLQTCLGLTGMR